MLLAWRHPRGSEFVVEAKMRYTHLDNASGKPMADDEVITGIAEEMLIFMEAHGVMSIIMTDGIIGCPHQEGIDYHGQWCPVCEFWKGRDRFTGERVH